ncbi:hypothetical protein AB5I41_31770 [Sphingomonas sp. MMS24-JH45]
MGQSAARRQPGRRGRRVDLSRIDAPFLHLAAEHDQIAPTAASAPLRTRSAAATSAKWC